jgi:electron transfer flavoprotein beta subunit
MPIHIIVCIKSVIRAAGGEVARRLPENCEFNPFDRPALEAALSMKATLGGSVTALSMGPPVAAAALEEAQAMGADRTVLVSSPALAGSDTLVTARVLAAAISRLATFDFVFFGTRTSDSDTGQVGPQTASLLNLPFVGGVRSIKAQGRHWEIQRTLDDWEEHWEVVSPAAVSIHARAFPPRHIGLPAIAEADLQPVIKTFGLADLGLTPEMVGLAGSPTRVVALQKVKHERTCEMIAAEPRKQVEVLIEQLNKRGVIES